mgnify:CR=1 FL=1
MAGYNVVWLQVVLRNVVAGGHDYDYGIVVIVVVMVNGVVLVVMVHDDWK